MDISQAKKLSQDKIEADFLTKIVRRNIKRKERERRQAREAFREAFEVVLESQDKSTKTQNLMLDELQRINARIDEEEQPQGREPDRYADRFPRGRDGRIILYGDSGDGGDEGDDDDQFFDSRDYVDQPRRPRRRRRPAIINQQDPDDIRDQQEEIRQQRQLQDLQQQLLDQRWAQQQQEELFNQQVQQQQRQERLNQLRQRLIQLQPQARPQQPQPQQDVITALQQQLAQERERTVALQSQNRESQRLNEEIQREQQAQEALQRQLVRSSDVFPESQSVRSTDVFPGSTAGVPPPLIPSYQAPQQPTAQLTFPTPYQTPQQPKVYDDEYHFPEIVDLGNFDNSYLEGVRQKLDKTINDVSFLINIDEGEAYLTPEKLRVLKNRKDYKQSLLNYRYAFISYLKQRRKNEEQMREQMQKPETVEEMFRNGSTKILWPRNLLLQFSSRFTKKTRTT